MAYWQIRSQEGRQTLIQTRPESLRRGKRLIDSNLEGKQENDSTRELTKKDRDTRTVASELKKIVRAPEGDSSA